MPSKAEQWDGAPAIAGSEGTATTDCWSGLPAANIEAATAVNKLSMQGLFALDKFIPAAGDNGASAALFKAGGFMGERFIEAANQR